MIRIRIPTLLSDDFSSKKDMRKGDCTIIKYDSGDVDVIDGYCEAPAARLVEYLKEMEYKHPFLTITHPHYDHYNGIERIITDGYFSPKALQCQDPSTIDKGFSRECAENVNALERIIGKAKAKDIPVVFLDDGDVVNRGDISYTVYRSQPKTAVNTEAYVNDGSLCFWFPSLKYLTTGDAGLECAKRNDLHPVFVKGGHHGNDLIMVIARWLNEKGCRFYWDNDYSETLTGFLMTGRENAMTVGMKCLGVHGDINFIGYGGKVVIYKGGEHWSYSCAYNGKLNLKGADLAVVKSVLRGSLGKMDERVTNLLDLGYAPVSVQDQVNELWKLIRG